MHICAAHIPTACRSPRYSMRSALVLHEPAPYTQQALSTKSEQVEGLKSELQEVSLGSTLRQAPQVASEPQANPSASHCGCPLSLLVLLENVAWHVGLRVFHVSEVADEHVLNANKSR